MSSKNINELMSTYFKNKDKIKAIKAGRTDYMNSDNWRCLFEAEGASMSCIDALKYQEPYETICDNCNKRHQFHLALNKRSHQNSGILKSVRAIVK